MANPPAFTCPDHGRYRAPYPPKIECTLCWAAYGRWRLYKDAQGKVRSVGRARGGGQSSKAKGRTAVQQVRDLMLSVAPGLQPDDLLVKATSMGGVDLHLSPAAARWFPFAIEVKCVEALNIWAALKQAMDQSNGKPPIVFFKRAHSPLYVALRAEDLLTLLPWPKNPSDALPLPQGTTPALLPSNS